MERGVMTVVVVVGGEVFCLSETKNCEVLERGVKVQKNERLYHQYLLVVCGWLWFDEC